MGNIKTKLKFSRTLQANNDRVLFFDAIGLILDELEKLGYRPRTVQDYKYHMTKLAEVNNIVYIDEVTRDAIVNYVADGDVKPSTRKIRLKTVKAMCNKLLDKGYLTVNTWHNLRVKVDQDVKKGTSEETILTLFNMLNLDSYVELRDFTAILLIWETGARIGTVSEVTYNMFDMTDLLVTYTAKIMKGRKSLTLPISQDLSTLVNALNEQNKSMATKNKRLFLSYTNPDKGNFYQLFPKRLRYYSEKYSLDNLRSHSLRRGFAKRLLDRGANVPIISKALGHASIDTTTQYLHLSTNEVVNTVRAINEG